MKNILLIQPVDLKFKPLGLMKLSSYYKKLNYNVKFVRGQDFFYLDEPDIICIDMGYLSKSFEKALDITNGIIKRYYKTDPDILIGGIQATINYEKIKHMEDWITNIIIIKGDLDCIKKEIPDYSLIDSEWQYTFTTKGCPRDCKWCFTNKIHESFEEIENWEKTLNLKHSKKIQFFDDNFLACSREHFDETIDKIKKLDLIVDFNQGLDIRFIDDYKAKRLSEIKIKPLRFSLDHSSLIKGYEEKIKIVLKYHKPRNIMTYCLVGYEGDLKKDHKRIMKIWEYKIDPFAMVYSENKDKKIRDLARWCNRKGCFKTVKFKDYLGSIHKKQLNKPPMNSETAH